MIVNLIMFVLAIGGIGGGIYWYINKLKNTSWEEEFTNTKTVDYLILGVKEIFSATQKQNLKEMNMSRHEMEKRELLKNQLRNSLKTAAYGDKEAKKFITSYIESLITTHKKVKVSIEDVDNYIHFNSASSLKSRDKFEILMYLYRQDYGDKCFTQMINDYDLDKPIRREDGSFYYDFTREMLDKIYDDVIDRWELDYNDKIKIIAARIFADYKGAGVVDTLLNANLDEIDCGVSGIPKDSYDIKSVGESLKKAHYSYESIWVMIHGINIRMSCLGFATQDELIRVCQNIYKFNAPTALSRKTGYVIASMKDGSRIVVVRPPFAESWAFFLRKFDSTPSINASDLLDDENNSIPITLMKWFIKGYRTGAITGEQGSGKSTTLKSIINYIPESVNLRIQEAAFELNLRYTYPDRNIMTFQETESISAQEGLDLQKKTNGGANIVGEVATAEAASWIIQTAMVASLFTLFTHHAKTAYDLIVAIRNNLLEAGGYSNEKAAEEMVSKVINFDFHMAKMKNHRYCERITEIIPIRDRRYPSERDENKGLSTDEKLAMDTIEYQKRVTDRQVFESVNLVEWVPNDTNTDDITGRYVMRHMPSDEMMMEIRSKLSAKEEQLFLQDMETLRGMIEEKAE